ncbi:MAG: carbohydrate kinase family protein [Chloroflexi bacterium]|nr:carbohydrate kinase family protein [Chloroflexota bacterium]
MTVQWVTFGIIVDDIVYPDGRTRMGVLGGGGPQTAWGMAAALGTGDAVGLVAGIGDDLDDSVLAPLHVARIDLAGLRHTDLPTPRAWQILEWDGRVIHLWRVDPAQTLGEQLARNRDVLPPTYRAARGFHWGVHPAEPGSLAFARDLRAAGHLVSLEAFRAPQFPLADDELRALLEACDVFSPNLHEAVGITGQHDYRAMLARLRDCGGQTVAVRRGADGADVWDMPAGQGVHVPAVLTQTADEVGAGNAFCGALLARLDAGLETAAAHASAAASYLLEQVGLPETLPDPAEYARRVDSARAGQQALTWNTMR